MADTIEKSIRILVVDDSAFMRKAITMMLESDPAIQVVGTARDGEEAVEKARLLKPDLITMDIEMPRMDGLTALREIMQSDPVPVMMVSSVTTAGAQATLEALDLGAVDFIPKQMSYVSLDIVKIKEELLGKIRHIASRKHLLMARHRQRQFAQYSSRTAISPAPPSITEIGPAYKIVPKKKRPLGIIAIGSSTGGPPALTQVLSKLPKTLPVGILIAQHMPPMFTRSLAERLDTLSQISVREACDGDKLEAGVALIAPGGRHMTVRRRAGQVSICVSDEPANTLYKPCVDVMVQSIVETFGGHSLGVILTGMGNNGLIGMKGIKSRGGAVIAQSEQTCVVYGMPRAVVDAGIADCITPIDSVAAEIASFF